MAFCGDLEHLGRTVLVGETLAEVDRAEAAGQPDISAKMVTAYGLQSAGTVMPSTP